MYKKNVISKGTIKVNSSKQGSTIEENIVRMLENKEPIEGESNPIFTERKDGVMAGYNIRTDKWAVAVQASGVASKTAIAKREDSIAERGKVIELNGEPESTQGNDGKP